MKSAISDRSWSAFGMAASRFSALCRSFSSSSTFWKTGKPLSARETRNCWTKPIRFSQQAKDAFSRERYGMTTSPTTELR